MERKKDPIKNNEIPNIDSNSDEEIETVPHNPLTEHDYCKISVLEEHSYSKQSWVFNLCSCIYRRFGFQSICFIPKWYNLKQRYNLESMNNLIVFNG